MRPLSVAVQRGGFPRALWGRAGIALGVWAIALSLLAAATALPGPPVAALSADDATPFVGETVRFDASASEGHDKGLGRVVAYRFEFGDGSGTEWDSSPVADHAYATAGRKTPTVTVRDGRGLEGEASLEILVRDVPPPTGDAPDLEPVTATVDPAMPTVDEVLRVAVTLLNRGGANATSATVVLTDRRPGGDSIPLGEIPLGDPLAPGAQRILLSGPFLAVGEGEHGIEIVVRDVAPDEEIVANNDLTIAFEVRPRATDDDTTPSAGPNLLTIGLAFGAILALAGAATALNRSEGPGPREPPPAAPPSREPPPPWPP